MTDIAYFDSGSGNVATTYEINADWLNGRTFWIVDDSTLPDEIYFSAWRVDGSGVITIDPTEKAEIDAEIAAEQAQQNKLIGVDFNGVMCSATASDMWGLSSIESHVLAGNDTNFYFENGNNLVLTSANWAAFRTTWVAFRESFFPLP